MVGGRSALGDLDRVHAERCARVRPRSSSARGVLAGDRRAGAGEARALAGDRHQRVQRERLVRREHGESGRARAVADQPIRTGADCAAAARDLAVGHAQQDDVGACPVGPAAQRP